MNVRARLSDPDEFYYPNTNEPLDLIEFWSVMEGYRLSKRDYEINWGSGIFDADSTELYTGDIVELKFNKQRDSNIFPNEKEEAYVEYDEGCFILTNKDGLVMDIGNSMSPNAFFILKVKGNIYDHLMP